MNDQRLLDVWVTIYVTMLGCILTGGSIGVLAAYLTDHHALR